MARWGTTRNEMCWIDGFDKHSIIMWYVSIWRMQLLWWIWKRWCVFKHNMRLHKYVCRTKWIESHTDREKSISTLHERNFTIHKIQIINCWIEGKYWRRLRSLSCFLCSVVRTRHQNWKFMSVSSRQPLYWFLVFALR